MKAPCRDTGFELIACGLLLGLLGWFLHRADPASVPQLRWVSLAGAIACLSVGVLAWHRPVNLRWCAGLLLGLSLTLGGLAWSAWRNHLAHADSYRPVPVLLTVLVLLTLIEGTLIWHGGRDGE